MYNVYILNENQSVFVKMNDEIYGTRVVKFLIKFINTKFTMSDIKIDISSLVTHTQKKAQKDYTVYCLFKS